MTPFFVEKCTELFEVLLIGLRSKRQTQFQTFRSSRETHSLSSRTFCLFRWILKLPLPKGMLDDEQVEAALAALDKA